MEAYGYSYPPPPFPSMRSPDGLYPDHGDGFGDYYGLEPLNGDGRRPGRSTHCSRKDRSRSRSESKTRSRSRPRSKSRSRSRSRTKSRSRSRSRTRSQSRHRNLNLKEPGFLDAFRVLYLAPSKQKKNTPKFLATKKRQDRIQDYLKSDGLGSKRWFFYPRNQNRGDVDLTEPKQSRETCDQRVKIDGDFFRKYRKSKKVDSDAPIAKLKRWELVFYKKLGFVQAV